MKVQDILKLVRSRGGIEEFPVRVYHGENLLWERLNQSAPVPPTGILRARYDATDSQTITTGTYQGGSVVQGWDSKEPAGSGLNTTLAQSNGARSPKLVSGAQGINSMQAVKFDGVDAHAATPGFPELHPQCENFKRDWIGSVTLTGDVEAGLYVRYFPWNDRYTTTNSNILGTHPDVVRYGSGISNYWMVNPTIIGFNRVGSHPPPHHLSNWQPVQLHDGTDPNLPKLDPAWIPQRINNWTNQPPAQDTYYYENHGWYFGAGVVVNHHQGDLLIAGDSPLLTTNGQQELLDGVTVIVLFRNDADPDPYSVEQKGGGVTNDISYVDHIDGRGSLWFHKNPHINTHAPWEQQLYFDYRDGVNSRIHSGVAAGYNMLGKKYTDITPTQPKILVYQLNNTTKKMSVHFDGELFIQGPINQTQDHITIQSTGDFRLANAGWSQAVTIGEVLIFQNAIDEKTRAVNEGYLAHKWGIDDKLPGWHQYKSAPPAQSLVESSWTKIGFTGPQPEQPETISNTYSVSFDTAGQRITVGDISELNSANAVSTSQWFKYSGSPSGATHVFTSAGNPGEDDRYYVELVGPETIRYGDASTYTDIAISNVSSSNWNNLVTVHDGTTLKIYLNGVLENTVTVSSVGTNLGTSFTIGAYYLQVGNYNYFSWQGLLDEVAVWDSGLTAENVTAIYNNGTPNNISSLNPVGWWRMGDNDSGTGTVITDQGSGGNDGTLVGGATFSTDVPRELPEVTNNYSVSFDGYDDYVDLGTSSSLNPSSSLTLSTWIYINGSGTGTFATIYSSSKNSAGTAGGIALAYTANRIRFYLDITGSSGWVYAETDSSPNTGQWYHVLGTWDGSTVTLYVNGNAQTTTANASTIVYNTDFPATIGRYSSDYFQGLVDEVALFDSALSESDITAIYNNGTPADISSLNPLGWWRMGDDDGGTGTVITDQGTGGNDGTLVGATFSTVVPGKLPEVTNSYSVSFDGSNGYVKVGNYNDYNFGSGGTDSAFSITAWINMEDATDFVVAAKDSDSGNKQYTIRFVDDKMHFYLMGGGYIGRTYNTTVTSDQGSWIHVAFTYDGSKSETGIKIYRNGIRVDDASYSSGTYVGMSATSAPFEIGRQGRGSVYSDGLIDEVAVYNSELTTSDITAIYNNGTPADISSLNPVGWWRMGDNDGGTGTAVTDQGSGGNDGTLIGYATFSTDVPGSA